MKSELKMNVKKRKNQAKNKFKIYLALFLNFGYIAMQGINN